VIGLGDLSTIASRDGVDARTVERDYVITHVMSALAAHPDSVALQFKGGTAFRLCLFPDYRYSADVDLNVLGVSKPDALRIMAEVLESCRAAIGFPHLRLSDEGAGVEFVGPTGSQRRRPVKLDLCDDELVLDAGHSAELIGRYRDQPANRVLRTYTPVEATGEKLRCVLQRLQCRDLYDIWWLLGEGGVDVGEAARVFRQKAAHRDRDPHDFAADFEGRATQYEGRWNQEMPNYIGSPPPLDRVLRDVRRHLRRGGLI
jgi:uncharacterized protein